MIVQTAAPGEPHFIVTQIDHARMSGDLAVAFGNEQFARPEPWELMTYVIAHHDEGWAEVDAAPARDPRTGLVYLHLQETFSDVVKTDKTGLSKTAHTRWMISAFANFLPGSTIFRLA